MKGKEEEGTKKCDDVTNAYQSMAEWCHEIFA
jgi:hypothetical protein